jgi:SET domain-containing protein
LGRLISHSRTAFNLKTVPHPFEGRPRVVLVATRDISRGEEMFYDYGERRRTVIQSFPWLDY